MNMNYYMLGIGGISMSALAMFLKEKGEIVSGYDERKSKATSQLEEAGIKVDFEQNEDAVKDADLIVYSSAIKDDNPIFKLAKKQNKIMICRGKLLGEISRDYEKVIAVAGAHGKTTVTAMIFEILKVAGLNPSLHLGGFRIEDGKNFSLGGKKYFVTEACEYCDNFLYLAPYISIVTNIEKEHLDYFKTFENELKSFERFKKQSKIVIDSCGQLEAKNIKHKANGGLEFSLFEKKRKVFDLSLHLCEEVNIENCIYAYQACKKLGVSERDIKTGLEKYRGVEKRFQKKESKFFDAVVCDYAHHPTEIRKAVETAKKIYIGKNVIVLFQPHTYSRTKLLLAEFIEIFKDCKVPLFYKTFSAREKEEQGVSAEALCDLVKQYNKNAKYFENFDDLADFFKGFKKKGNVLLVVGAGDLPEILHKNNFIS